MIVHKTHAFVRPQGAMGYLIRIILVSWKEVNWKCFGP